MNINGTEVIVRDPLPGDINFILSTMLKGLYYGSEFWQLVDQEAFFKNYEPFIKSLMLRSDIKVACLADDEDVILGYSMYKNEAIHFIFVKKSYRKLGLARSLYPPGITITTHLTSQGDHIRRKLNLKFNPFIM